MLVKKKQSYKSTVMPTKTKEIASHQIGVGKQPGCQYDRKSCEQLK